MKPGGERIAAADAVQDLDVALRDLVELPLVPADGAPAVDRRRARRAQRGRDGLDVGERGDDVVDHRAERAPSAASWKCGSTFSQLEAERRREVLLVAEQHVDERHQRPVDLARLHLAADRPPERIAVVEVVRHAGAVLVRLFHRGVRDRRRPLRQRAEHAARCGTSATLPAPPNSCFQSTSPGSICDTAVWPRSEQPTPPRGPKPRSVKFSPLRTLRPTPSYSFQRR